MTAVSEPVSGVNALVSGVNAPTRYVTELVIWGNAAENAGAGPVIAVVATVFMVFATVFPVTKPVIPVVATDSMDDEPEVLMIATLIVVNAT